MAGQSEIQLAREVLARDKMLPGSPSISDLNIGLEELRILGINLYKVTYNKIIDRANEIMSKNKTQYKFDTDKEKDPMGIYISETEEKILSIATDAREECIRAAKKYGPFNSTHEGYAVLKEEVDELWDNVKRNANKEDMREEAVQVAAMAIRFVLDLC